MKKFFRKIVDYVKNTAWIQPLLIVVVIFVLLFSLSPLTTGVTKLWTNITTVNRMEKISYDKYCSLVKGDMDSDVDKFIVVFTDKNDENTAVFFKSMNNYITSSDYKSGKSGFKVYSVNITQKSATRKYKDSNGTKTKCNLYKDSTIGIVCPSAKLNDSVLSAKDSLLGLDSRLNDFANAFTSDPYSELSTSTYNDSYDYISGQVVIWYQRDEVSHAAIETRINNDYLGTGGLSIDSTGKKVSASSFKSYIEEFDVKATYSYVSEIWTEPFDLTSQKSK